MSFFQNLKILLKKHYIITSSASACGIPRPYLYGVEMRESFTTNDCIMQRFANRQLGSQKWSQKLGSHFGEFLDSWFLGMF
jgi:hypothetical protein